MGGHIRLWVVGLGALLLACSSDGFRDLHAKLRVEPLRFGRVAVGMEETRQLSVKNVGRGAISILGIERGAGLSEVFAVTGDPVQRIRGGGTAGIAVRFRPQDVTRYEGTLFLITDDPERPRIEVPIDGIGDRPSVACSPELAFDRVVLNTEKVLSLSCVNGGRIAADVRVGPMGGDDPQFFSLVDAQGSLRLEPGETVGLLVRFSAQRLGLARAILPLTVIAAEVPEQEVALSGEGYASSLVAAPNCLHFGPVNPGQIASGRVIVANGGDVPVNFEGPAVVDASGVFAIAEVRVDGRSGDLVRLEPQQQAELEIEFAPASIGRFSGALLLRNDDPIASHLEVCLTGAGGGADIAAEPNPLDFGQVAVGMEVKKTVWVRNAGTHDGGPLEVHGAQVSGNGFGLVGNASYSLTPSDDARPIEVSFAAPEEGSFFGTLLVESNDGDQPVLPIPLLGSARELPPCVWRAEPPVLSFVPVQIGTHSQLVANLVNEGDDDCVFASPRMAPGTPAAFSLTDDTPSFAVVGPGEHLSLGVRFHAQRIGKLEGELLFDVSNPAAPVGSIPLEANTIDGCLRFEPPVADFGLRRESCPAAVVEVELVNHCAGGISVHTAVLDGEGSAPGEIQVSGPEAPFHLARNASVIFHVYYDPVDEGPDGAMLRLTSTMHPLSLPIFGRGTLVDERTDTFRQQARSPVDILFVIDNSGSMTDKQRAVAEGCEQFMRYAVQQGIDFHIGVTTTGISRSVGGWVDCPGGAYGGEAGRLFPVNRQRPRWVTSDMPDAAAIFAENVQVGTCHWLEQGLEAAYRALSSPLVDSQNHPSTSSPSDGNLGFYRPEARLSVVIISDEDDQSDRPLSFYRSFFLGLKGPGRERDVSVNAVVGRQCGFSAEEGVRYMDVAQATGGMIEPICTSDWGDALGRLAEQSFGYTLSFPLSSRPEGEVVVRVDGAVVTTGWSYDPAFNAVVFTEDSAPPPGSLVELTYIPAC